MSNENELNIENYHKKSEDIEEELLLALLLLLTPLMISLSSMQPLTKQKVEDEIAIWLGLNIAYINEINTEQLQRIKDIVNSIFKKSVVTPEESRKYTASNDELVVNIVEDLKNKFKELAILEQNYPMNEEIRKNYTNNIINHTENKTKLFATMSTISTIRSLMFEHAIAEGYTEYQWHTQRDNRVRPTHAYMDKRWVKFNEPPKITSYNHVAQEWNCRCFADKFR